MRLAICVAESNSRDWLTAEGFLVRMLSDCLATNDHVLVRRGSILGFAKAEATWLAAGADKARTDVWNAHQDVTAYLLGGLREEQVADVANAASSIPGVLGASIVWPAERQLLMKLEHELPLKLRLVGSEVRVLHPLAALDEDLSPYESIVRRLSEAGLAGRVRLEDTGLEDTVFDYANNGPAFLRRIELAEMCEDPWLSERVAIWLTSVDPALKDALHAAARAAATASTRELAAQAALSVRRYLERLANAIFPASVETRNGRVVDKKSWMNRLWAALDERGGGSNEVEPLGRLLDELKVHSNSVIHHPDGLTPAEARTLVADLLSFSDGVRALCAPATVAPLEPYEPEVFRLLLRMFPKETEQRLSATPDEG